MSKLETRAFEYGNRVYVADVLVAERNGIPSVTVLVPGPIGIWLAEEIAFRVGAEHGWSRASFAAMSAGYGTGHSRDVDLEIGCGRARCTVVW